MTLSDKDMIGDMLAAEKQLAGAHHMGAAEAANESLRQTFESMWKETHELHARIFSEMQRRGWYKTTTASETQINKTINSWEKSEHKNPVIQSQEGDS